MESTATGGGLSTAEAPATVAVETRAEDTPSPGRSAECSQAAAWEDAHGSAEENGHAGTATPDGVEAAALEKRAPAEDSMPCVADAGETASAVQSASSSLCAMRAPDGTAEVHVTACGSSGIALPRCPWRGLRASLDTGMNPLYRGDSTRSSCGKWHAVMEQLPWGRTVYHRAQRLRQIWAIEHRKSIADAPSDFPTDGRSRTVNEESSRGSTRLPGIAPVGQGSVDEWTRRMWTGKQTHPESVKDFFGRVRAAAAAATAPAGNSEMEQNAAHMVDGMRAKDEVRTLHNFNSRATLRLLAKNGKGRGGGGGGGGGCGDRSGGVAAEIRPLPRDRTGPERQRRLPLSAGDVLAASSVASLPSNKACSADVRGVTLAEARDVRLEGLHDVRAVQISLRCSPSVASSQACAAPVSRGKRVVVHLRFCSTAARDAEAASDTCHFGPRLGG